MLNAIHSGGVIEFDVHWLYTGFESMEFRGGKMKILRLPLIILGLILSTSTCSWFYTTVQLNIARSKGVYESAEQGMLAHVDKYYPADRDVKVLYAGTNSFDGSKPYLWYVIAEIHAAARADGSEMGRNSCDAPGSFFLHTKEGWVFVPEGAFPTFIGFWMNVFGMAGEGQSTPSTNWAPDQPAQFCLK
jgi:hypothetical protein